MDRATLESRQVWVYLSALLPGLLCGSAWPGLGPRLEVLLWPVLALLMYATFVQVPLLHLREAFGDRRFVAAVVIVVQSLVELFGMVLYLRWVPRRLFPQGPAQRAP